MRSQIKKLVAVLLAVFFVSSLIAVTVNAQPTNAAYQDKAWLEYVTTYSNILTPDLLNLANAAEDLDFPALGTAAQKLVDDTQKAIKENSKYKVSPKFKAAQKEWVAGLKDTNSAGRYYLKTANDAKAGTLTVETIEKANSFISSGTVHINKANKLLKAAAGLS